MVTKSKGKRAIPCGRRAGALLKVTSGSATVPIYRTESNGRIRFALCFYRDGRRERKIFTSLKAGDVGVFTPDEMAKILHAAPPHLVPILAIGAFSGIRMAELNRLDWSAIDLDQRFIEVRAGQAKTASRRIIPISVNLAAWLTPLERRGKVVKTPDLHNQVTALARALDHEWPRNVLRHSYISYRIAKVKSADQVALEAGNSPSIIFKHYRELTTEDQADAWFGILPKPGQWQNTITYNRLTRTVTLTETTGK